MLHKSYDKVSAMKIHIINGPNLNLLGRRNPEQYGPCSYPELIKKIEEYAEEKDIAVSFFQSNHEGEIVDNIHSHLDNIDGMIINPGALSHYSYSIRDALEILESPVIEVHISNIQARESFRNHSVISPVCTGQISGLGAKGYFLGLNYFLKK